MTINADAQKDLDIHQQHLVKALTRLADSASARLFADVPTDSTEDITENFFSFSIGVHHFLVEARHFCEVFTDVGIAPLPNAPRCLLGLCNIRGTLLPVYKLHDLLTEKPPKKPTIFCVGKNERAVALLIDALPVSLGLRAQERLANVDSGYPWLNKIVISTYFSGGIHWHLLNAERIGEELLLLSQHEQQAQPQAAQRFYARDLNRI